jgi:hypothetical protein
MSVDFTPADVVLLTRLVEEVEAAPQAHGVSFKAALYGTLERALSAEVSLPTMGAAP